MNGSSVQRLLQCVQNSKRKVSKVLLILSASMCLLLFTSLFFVYFCSLLHHKISVSWAFSSKSEMKLDSLFLSPSVFVAGNADCSFLSLE